MECNDESEANKAFKEVRIDLYENLTISKFYLPVFNYNLLYYIVVGIRDLHSRLNSNW